MFNIVGSLTSGSSYNVVWQDDDMISFIKKNNKQNRTTSVKIVQMCPQLARCVVACGHHIP